MKLNILAVMAVATLLAVGSALAQNSPGNGGRGQGKGYGGPPQSDEERATRQAECLDRNGGICPQGGPRADCPVYGQRRGGERGKGQGHRRGLRDGTGPRKVEGSCAPGQGSQQENRGQ